MTKILICGAYNDTGNLGVSALGNAAAATIYDIEPDLNIAVQNFSGKIENVNYSGLNGDGFEVETISLTPSRNLLKPDSLNRMRIEKSLGLSFINSFHKRLKGIDLFLDVAGGDSFTDLYGDARFSLINAIKEEAVRSKKPLILLPQTYGPFREKETARVAKEYILYAKQAWARDVYSYELMKDVLGQDFDSGKHRCGVDMAFLLPVVPSDPLIATKVLDWIESGAGFVGINVSGLIYNRADEARNRYNFKADYVECLIQLVEWVLKNTDKNIVIVPHVLVDDSLDESDFKASVALAEKFSTYSERICVQPSTLDQCKVKYLISKCDWFMGTRMHATIAGLSTCVPTSTISYSDKALGVFKSADCEEAVIDPRKLDTDAVVSRLIDSFKDRDVIREKLLNSIPKVKLRAREQMVEILRSVSVHD